MDEEEYLTDDGEDLDETGYYQSYEDEDGDEVRGDEDESEESYSPPEEPEQEVANYNGKMTIDEIKLCTAYDDIVAAGKKSNSAIEDAGYIIVNMNPKHTNVKTMGDIIKEMYHMQGHNRMRNSVYTSETALRGRDVDEDFLGEEDGGFNEQLTEELSNLIARFIDYLANRDLSKDSTSSRNNKNRHIPAFIIYLFSTGAYYFILHCPTMPRVYQKQIDNAVKKINQYKYDIVEELAKAYEAKGRPLVAERVRKLQLAWFDREPATIRTVQEYADLDLTYDDVLTYREYRSKFTNSSRAITQDVISDLIEVSDDTKKGTYYKLKDKTRLKAIIEVKDLWRQWCKDNAADQELADRLIWKN